MAVPRQGPISENALLTSTLCPCTLNIVIHMFALSRRSTQLQMRRMGIIIYRHAGRLCGIHLHPSIRLCGDVCCNVRMSYEGRCCSLREQCRPCERCLLLGS